jgi:hypothetical protein
VSVPEWQTAAQDHEDVSSPWARAALSHRICTGLPRRRLGKLIIELAGPWMAQQESRLRDRRGHDRQRAAGAGPGRELPFTDRVIATLVVLRFQLARGNCPLGTAQAPAVLPADLRGARYRRTQAVALPAALDRPP